MLGRTAAWLHGKRGDGAAAAALAEKRRQRIEAAGGAQRVRHSGVQLDVLSLYRGLMREANRRTDPESRDRLRTYVRAEFQQHKAIERKEIARIEWLLHYGRTRLEELQAQKPTTGFNILR